MAPYPVQIRPERKKNLLAGHPWVFSGALAETPKIPDGSLVSLRCGREALGTGYYNSRTDIAVRLLSRKQEEIDKNFFRDRFRRLQAERKAFLPPDTNAYRLVFGEADGCPGLIVDRYADILVAQFHTLGMDRLRDAVIPALVETFSPRAVVERSDVGARKFEGLTDQPVGVLHGALAGEMEIREYGHRFLVDVLRGQKTGFFLDQRENRRALQRWCVERSVLNLFCYTGGFSVYAAAAGAKRVINMDASEPAIAMCRRNLELNGFGMPDGDFRVQDVFDALSDLPAGESDCIVIDPPSFAKSRAQLKSAIKAYITLNTKALQALPDGGILATASCTSHLDSLTFIKILHQSAVNAGCSLKILEIKEQPFDHPYNLTFPEGRYLKFVVGKKGSQ